MTLMLLGIYHKFVIIQKMILNELVMENTFVHALDQGPKTTVGENSSDSYTQVGVEDYRVALAFKLTRGLDRKTLRQLVSNVIRQAQGQSVTVIQQHYLD